MVFHNQALKIFTNEEARKLQEELHNWYISTDIMKVNKWMRWAKRGTCKENVKCVPNFSRKPKEKRLSKYLGIDGRIILK
jgi:hypothetical protein